MKKLTIICSSLIFALSLQAQQAEDMNFKGEKERIKQGVKSGELTKREVKNIKHDMKDVRQAKRMAKADGVVSPEESKIISQKDKQLDKKIYNKKHNNKKRRH